MLCSFAYVMVFGKTLDWFDDPTIRFSMRGFQDQKCGVDKEQPLGDKELISKPRLSSDRSLQLDSVKLDSLVIAHQPWRGEYVPGPCTHRPSSHGSREYLKSVTARIGLG